MPTNPVHPGTALDQALNIAYAAAHGQNSTEPRNDEHVSIVSAADTELRSLRALAATPTLEPTRCASCSAPLSPTAERIDFAWQRFHGPVPGAPDAIANITDRATVCNPVCGAEFLGRSK